MSLQTESRGNVFIVRPQGVLSLELATEMDALLEEALDDGACRLLFDFTELTRLSSDGLRVILKSLRRLQMLGGTASLIGAGEQVHSTLTVGGFLSLLEEFNSIEDALEHPAVDDEA